MILTWTFTKKTIAEINRCTTRYDTVRQKYLNQLEDSEKILSLLKQATQQMQQLNTKLSTNIEPNTSNQNKLPHLPFKNLEINHLKYDQIDDIAHPLDIPEITTEVKETSIFKLSATQLDSLQSTTTPLNIPRFKELRDKYENCLNQIRTFLIQLEGLRGKHLDPNIQSTLKEIKEAITSLKQKEKDLESELNDLASKKSNIHHTLPMSQRYGKIDNPSQDTCRTTTVSQNSSQTHPIQDSR